jgi:hypothetical protein
LLDFWQRMGTGLQSGHSSSISSISSISSMNGAAIDSNRNWFQLELMTNLQCRPMDISGAGAGAGGEGHSFLFNLH